MKSKAGIFLWTGVFSSLSDYFCRGKETTSKEEKKVDFIPKVEEITNSKEKGKDHTNVHTMVSLVQVLGILQFLAAYRFLCDLSNALAIFHLVILILFHYT